MPQSKPAIAAPKEYIQSLQTATEGLPLKGAWTIRVVSPGQWQGMSQPGMRADQGHMPHAYSDLKSRVTYLPQDSLKSLSANDLRRVLAHELGHLTLNTSDENKANKWSDQQMRTFKPKRTVKLKSLLGDGVE